MSNTTLDKRSLNQNSPNRIAFTLDGQTIMAEPGQTLMKAAEAAGIYIPHLCYHPSLAVNGNCKLCTVKVNGRLVTACSYQPQTEDRAENRTDELRTLRQHLLQLMLVEGNHYCPGCEQSGQCQLQASAYAEGVTDNYFHQRYPKRQVDGSHPDFLLDRDRCILCGLCARASEADGKRVFSIGGRGEAAYLAVNTDSGQLGDSALAVEDLAADICPVGALIRRGQAFHTPIGQRLYDNESIDQVGNKRPKIATKEGSAHE